MRDCPICQSPKRDKLKSHYASAQWSLFRCNCGMLYLDSDEATEESMNTFYRTVYTSNDPPAFTDSRLGSLAQFVMENCNPPILDIGGVDGRLAAKIDMEVDTSGAGDEVSGTYQTVILSHTLEHVYNVKGMMEKIKAHLNPGGLVVVEVPIWLEFPSDFTGYDYHFEHVNKFTPLKLKELFERHGFSIEQACPIDYYIEYNCYRLLAKYERQ